MGRYFGLQDFHAKHETWNWILPRLQQGTFKNETVSNTKIKLLVSKENNSFISKTKQFQTQNNNANFETKQQF